PGYRAPKVSRVGFSERRADSPPFRKGQPNNPLDKTSGAFWLTLEFAQPHHAFQPASYPDWPIAEAPDPLMSWAWGHKPEMRSHRRCCIRNEGDPRQDRQTCSPRRKRPAEFLC